MRRIALALLLISVSAVAQQPPGLERGFSPERVYQFSDLDSINTFNGNLTVRIPIGPSYPVNGGLSYSLSLTYNSKVWDYEDFAGRSLAVPNRRSNSGMGWLLSLGRIITPDNSTNTGVAWVYEGPDGHDHAFYSKLHDDDPATTFSPPVTAVEYTRDGTYMRRLMKNDNTFDVEYADGGYDTFNATTGDLMFIRDRFFNYAWISWVTNINNTQCSGTPSFVGAWQIQDSQTGRKNYVCFSSLYPYREPTYPGNIDRVVLTVPPLVEGGPTRTATYQFGYAFTRICKGPHTTLLNPPDHFDIPLLTSVTQPDGSSYNFHYPPYDPVANCSGSTLTSLDLPTGGTISYTYREYMIPTDNCGNGTWNSVISGVGTRKFSGPRITPGQEPTWTYSSDLTSPDALVLCENAQQILVFRHAPAEQLRVQVVDPLGNVDESYYSVWPVSENVYDLGGNLITYGPSPNGSVIQEYGLPITHLSNHGGRLLSSRVFTPSGFANGTPLRSLFRNFERDVTSCVGQDRFCSDANSRMVRERTVYHDDNNAIADADSANFDGLGHYRTVTLGGTFSSGAATTVTAYNKRDADVNPSSGIDSGTYPGAFNLPSGDTRWMINTASSVRHTEAGTTAITQSCFDPMTGFLRAHRVLSSNTRSSSDVLTLFSSDSGGNIATESFFGGDIKVNAPDAALCSIADSPPNDFEYKFAHTYTDGIRATTQPNGVGYFTLNRSIDSASGFLMSEKDTADQATTFAYDNSFRLSSMQSPGRASTGYFYFPASLNGSLFTPAHVEVRTVSSDSNTTSGATTSGTVEKQYYYDDFGRPWREKTFMPDNTWSLRETLYNKNGWKDTVSEQEKVVDGGGGAELGFTPIHLTRYSQFDPFGRAGSIQLPDGKSNDFQYFGVGSVVRTIHEVATSLNGVSDVDVTEAYDRQGRLASVKDHSAPDGSYVVTSYGYDVGGRLSSAAMGQQHRYFTYDNRGFLLWEQHPEKGGDAGNGRIIYGQDESHPNYDSRGHARRRVDGPFDLTFAYDSAERLRTMTETGSSLLVKDFTYENFNNAGSDLRKGKLVTATRVNHLVDGREAKVVETLTYAGRGGAASQRDTEVFLNGVSFQKFTNKVEYDDLGAIAKTIYPTCLVPCATPSGGIGTVEHHYTNGALTSVTNFASSLSYNPNGTLAVIVHSNGVSDTIAQDDNSMPRPKSITYSGFTSCPTPSTPTISPNSTSLCAGDSSGATVQSPQSGVTYNWTIEGGMITSSSTGTSITFTATTPPSTVLHVTGTNSCGTSPTGSASIAVTASTSINQQPQNTTVPYNTTATLHVVATGGNLTYRWYRGNSGDTTNPETGPTATTPDFTTPALTANTTYWVKVTGQCGAVNSASATVTVGANNLPAPTGVWATTTQGSVNTSVTIRWNAVSGASAYRVEYSTNVQGTFAPIDPANPNTTQTSRVHTVSATSSPIAYVYRVRCVDSNGNVSSNISSMDYAVAGAQLFAIGHAVDEPLRKGQSPVKGADVAELRNAIDALRAAASTAAVPLPPVWNGAPPPTGVVTAANLTSMQAPLNAALQVFGWPAFSYTGVPAPVACTSAPCVAVLTEHVQQLRDTLRNALR
jgi:hypothetical protein